MNNLMEYKGYYGSIEYSEEDGVFCGEVVNAPHWLIMYDGEDLATLKFNFEDVVDDCLLMCEQRNEPPIPQSPQKLQEYLAEQQNQPAEDFTKLPTQQLQPMGV